MRSTLEVALGKTVRPDMGWFDDVVVGDHPVRALVQRHAASHGRARRSAQSPIDHITISVDGHPSTIQTPSRASASRRRPGSSSATRSMRVNACSRRRLCLTLSVMAAVARSPARTDNRARSSTRSADDRFVRRGDGPRGRLSRRSRSASGCRSRHLRRPPATSPWCRSALPDARALRTAIRCR